MDLEVDINQEVRPLTYASKAPRNYRPNFSDSERQVVAKQILDRFMHSDETIQEIADSVGVPMRTAYRWLVQYHEDDYKQAQVGLALAEYEDAKMALQRADGQWQVARASQQCRNAQWELERVLRRVYGDDKAQIAAVQVNILMDFSDRVAPQGGMTHQVIDHKG